MPISFLVTRGGVDLMIDPIKDRLILC